MIRVHIRRDGVSNGDDFHREAEWEFDDDAVVGEVVVRTVEEHFLASVGGNVGWVLLGGGGQLALLQTEYPGPEIWVTQVGPNLNMYPLTRFVQPEADGRLALYWRYVSNGQRLTFADFKYWIEETPEQAADRRTQRARDIQAMQGDRIRRYAERQTELAREARESDGDGGG